jgi:hypothetical protein
VRRFAAWILVVALVGSGTVALAGVAAADASRPASFCSSARNLADEFEDFDPNDLTDTEVFATAERAYKKLARQAPSSLESAFKRITAYYETLEGADGAPTDPEDVAEFIEQSTKVGKALNKVFRYLSSKCDIDLG